MKDDITGGLLEIVSASGEIISALVEMLSKIKHNYPYVFKEVIGDDDISDAREMNDECKSMLHNLLGRLEESHEEE